MLYDMYQDKPDMFETLGVTKGELLAKLVKNKCLGTMKYLANQHRRRVSELIEDHYTKEETQELANGGIKFHPYL